MVGDIMFIEMGDIISVDGLLIKSNSISIYFNYGINAFINIY